MGVDDIEKHVEGDDPPFTTMLAYTPLKAAMRTFVAMKFGESIDMVSAE